MVVEAHLSGEAAARFVLGLGHNWTTDDVNRAYRRLALIFHPDKNTGTNVEEATRRFQSIAKAKEYLLGVAAKCNGNASSTTPSKATSWKRSFTNVVAEWICGACQMKDLGSSPGSNTRCSAPCARSSAFTQCFCGHTFAMHDVCDSSTDIKKLRCGQDGCLCAEFSYTPQGALCTCGHGPSTHDARAFHGCDAPGCGCQTFHSAGTCACRHSWACHRTEIRRASNASTAAADGRRGSRSFCGWWRGGGVSAEDTFESKTGSFHSSPSSGHSESPPRAARRTNFAWGNSFASPRNWHAHEQSQAAGCTTAKTAEQSSSSSSVGPSFAPPLRPPRMSFHRPRSAQAGGRTPSNDPFDASSASINLDVQGHPVGVASTPRAASRPKNPESAPSSARSHPSFATDTAASGEATTSKREFSSDKTKGNYMDTSVRRSFSAQPRFRCSQFQPSKSQQADHGSHNVNDSRSFTPRGKQQSTYKASHPPRKPPRPCSDSTAGPGSSGLHETVKESNNAEPDAEPETDQVSTDVHPNQTPMSEHRSQFRQRPRSASQNARRPSTPSSSSSQSFIPKATASDVRPWWERLHEERLQETQSDVRRGVRRPSSSRQDTASFRATPVQKSSITKPDSDAEATSNRTAERVLKEAAASVRSAVRRPPSAPASRKSSPRFKSKARASFLHESAQLQGPPEVDGTCFKQGSEETCGSSFTSPVQDSCLSSQSRIYDCPSELPSFFGVDSDNEGEALISCNRDLSEMSHECGRDDVTTSWMHRTLTRLKQNQSGASATQLDTQQH